MTAKFTGSGFSKDALTLTNSNDKQGLAFPIWGNPEREKLRQLIGTTNIEINAIRGGIF